MIDINESVMQFLLAFIVVGPLLGAAAALLPAPPGLKGKSPEQAVLRHGVTVTGVVLIAAIVLALGFDHDHPSKMQATTDISWIPALDVRIHLGIDGISLPLLVLTALLTFLCALYSYFKMPAGPSPKAFVALRAGPRVRHPRDLRRPRPAAVLPRLRDGPHPDVLPHRPLGRSGTGPRRPGSSSSSRCSDPWSCCSACS